MRYFIIGTVFNGIRILALGIAIGYVCKRLYRGINPSVVAAKPAGLK
jgi:hypothetical protein